MNEASAAVVETTAPTTQVDAATIPEEGQVDAVANDNAEQAPDAAKVAREELSRLAKAEKARWRERQTMRDQQRAYNEREQQRDARIREMEAQLTRARSNPLEWAEESGVTPEQMAQTLVKRGTDRYEIEQLQSTISEMKAEAKRARELAEQAEYTNGRTRAENEFHGIVTADEDAFPTLSSMPKNRVIRLAHELATEIREKAISQGYRDYKVDPKELASYLEKQEAKIYERRMGKGAGKTGNSSGNPQDVGSHGSKAASPRTLTNSQAAQRNSLPVKFDELSDKEQNAILVQKLKEGWRG